MTEGSRRWTPVAGTGSVPPAGAYSPAARAGGFIFLAGQVPKDPVTGVLTGGDVRAQTRQVMANVERVLASAGAGLGDIVSLTVWLASLDDWQAFDETYREIMQPPWPPRTTVGAELRGFLVEVSVIAADPSA